jgi:hypothetical protein
MEVCEACEAREVHAAVEVVAQKAVVLSPILGQRSARRRRVIAQSTILTIATVTVTSVKQSEQEVEDSQWWSPCVCLL